MVTNKLPKSPLGLANVKLITTTSQRVDHHCGSTAVKVAWIEMYRMSETLIPTGVDVSTICTETITKSPFREGDTKILRQRSGEMT